ncbi:putative reverse transcriptase domain-containing protein [Tanacetum coccineum]
MVAPVISISSDTSKESVGSHAPRVILFGAILAIIPVIHEVPIVPADPIVTPEVGEVSAVSPAVVLDLVDYSPSSDSDPSEDYLPPAPDLPLVLPFLCSDDTEADDKSEPAEQRPVSSSHDTLAPLSEFPLAPVVAPLGIRRHSTTLIRPGEAIPFGRPYRTHPNGPRKLLTARKRIREDDEEVAVGRVEDWCGRKQKRQDTRDSEIAASDVRKDDEEFEAEASAADLREIVVDPLAIGDTSESSRGDTVGDNGNGKNGNCRNGNPNKNGRGDRPVARECTYQDFMKWQPLNFKGMEGVVGLIRWFEKMEIVFHIRNCPEKYQVKTIRAEAAFTMSWRELMKLMTEVYCPRNEIQKMESELWNLTMKNNDLAAYTQRFQELSMMCTKMVPKEEDRVEKFIRGLLDNIQGNKEYAVKNAENKRRLEVNQRDNRRQQPPFKRPNVGGQNVARAYTAGNNERKSYNGLLPLYNKCKLHHEGPCTVRCGKFNKVGHLTWDCKVTSLATSTQRGQVVN